MRTYSYNASVIKKNSISQHGGDLAVKLEREIDKGVTYDLG
jgi:hypothetical protein